MGIARTFIGSIRKKFPSFEIKTSIKPMSLALLGPFLPPYMTGGNREAGMGTNRKEKQS